MLISELRELIKIEITGNLVSFEIHDSVLDRLINDAVRRARAWYVENFSIETVVLYEALGGSAIVRTSDLSRVPGYIEDLWGADTSDISDLTGLALVSNLYGISSNILFYVGTGYEFGDMDYQASAPGQSVYDDWFITYANYLTLRPGLLNLMPRLEWDWDKNRERIWVSGVLQDQKVTVVYGHLPQTLEEVTDDKALDWIQDFAIARTKIALAHARGKFRSGGINFETDASDLLSNGTEAVRDLKEKLKDLQLINAVER